MARFWNLASKRVSEEVAPTNSSILRIQPHIPGCSGPRIAQLLFLGSHISTPPVRVLRPGRSVPGPDRSLWVKPHFSSQRDWENAAAPGSFCSSGWITSSGRGTEAKADRGPGLLELSPVQLEYFKGGFEKLSTPIFGRWAVCSM